MLRCFAGPDNGPEIRIITASVDDSSHTAPNQIASPAADSATHRFAKGCSYAVSIRGAASAVTAVKAMAEGLKG